MIVHLGIAVHDRDVCVVIASRGRVTWQAQAPRAADGSVADVLRALLVSLPRHRMRSASIALGLRWTQIKALHGMPPAKDGRLLSRLIHENITAFFLGKPGQLVVSDVVRRDDGTLWAAAFDFDVVSQAVDVLRGIGISRIRVFPSVAAFASVASPGVHVWTDGDFAIELSISSEGAITSTRYLVEPSPVGIEIPASMIECGAATWPAAIAVAVSRLSSNAHFAWTPTPQPRRTATIARLRVAAGVATLLLAGGAAVIAPGVRATLFIRENTDRVIEAREIRKQAARALGDLNRVNALLAQIDGFQSSRGRTTMLLAELSRSLPESTAVVSLRLDSLDASLVAVSPRATNIIPQLFGVPGVLSPQIVGSITREALGPIHLERATIRFRRLAETKRSPLSIPVRARGE
jgi:hypothetical protein